MNKNTIIVYAIGRRKKATAQVIFCKGNRKLMINNQNGYLYLQNNFNYIQRINNPFLLVEIEDNFDIFVKVKGGGLTGQTDAIKLAISRALVMLNSNNRKVLKNANLLKRDPRAVERKKYGLKKARKASQFSKR